MIEVRTGHNLDLLPAMPAGSVQCCLTSPPYWGLRDYGDPGRAWPSVTFSPMPGLPPMTIPASCEPLGLESDPWAYVGHLVALFREVRRVLADDGVLFLNLGDSYGGPAGNTRGPGAGGGTARGLQCGFGSISKAKAESTRAKDLVGIPWRVAFALQADGWYLRSDVIWSKPNPMPESVRDRPTKAHEYVFLLAKSGRYFWDQDAVRESALLTGGGTVPTPDKAARAGQTTNGTGASGLRSKDLPTGRNPRTVWTIPTQPYPGAHFAVWPPELAARCIKAGSRKGDTVLDPFGGSGTTGLVAREHGRSCVLLEQSPTYADMARARLGQAPEDTETAKASTASLPLFGGGQ